MASTKTASEPVAFKKPKTNIDENFERVLHTVVALPARENIEPRIVTLPDEEVARLNRKVEAARSKRTLMARARSEGWPNELAVGVAEVASLHHDLVELSVRRNLPQNVHTFIASIGEALARVRAGE